MFLYQARNCQLGMKETAAKNNIETITGKYQHFRCHCENQGYLKYIACKESHRIIGAIIVANIANWDNLP